MNEFKKEPDLMETKKTNMHQESEFCLLNIEKISTNTARKRNTEVLRGKYY